MKVYEFSFNYNYNIFLGLFIILCIITMGLGLFFKSNRNTIKVFIIVFFAFLSYFVCNSIYFYPYSRYKLIVNAINNDQILYVSGEVTDFHTPELKFGNHEFESFKINGIEFKYSEYESYGYSTISKQNGVIYQNGQKLKIGYYEEYDYVDKNEPSRRVIVSIEILDEK